MENSLIDHVANNFDSINDYSDELDSNNYNVDIQSQNARNVIINKFSNFTEVIYYKQPFLVGNFTNKQNIAIDRSRKFKYDSNNELQIARDGVTFNDLIKSNNRSRRRSVDTFLGYALCNKWHYFITLTFDSKVIDRKNKACIQYAWQKFRQKMQYYFPDVRILLVTEEHKTDGCLHLHGLIGNCDLSPYLSVAINNMKYINYFDYNLKQKVYVLDKDGNKVINKYYGSLLKTSFGDQIYNIDSEFYNFGFNSLIELHKEDVPGDNAKVVMYLLKYMKKDYNSVEYNKKAYYRTYNLNYKEKYVTKSIDTDTGEVLDVLCVDNKIIKKENDKMIVYLVNNN